MTYIRDKAETLLKANVRLNHELRQADDRCYLYGFLAFTGWAGLVVTLLTKYFP